MKSFHLGDVLSVTTGKLVGPSGIGGVYEVCDFRELVEIMENAEKRRRNAPEEGA